MERKECFQQRTDAFAIGGTAQLAKLVGSLKFTKNFPMEKTIILVDHFE